MSAPAPGRWGTGLRDPSGDAGAGSVLVVALCAALVVGALAAGSLVQAAVARKGAATAADLGALAAADLVAVGDPGGCEAAGVVVRANAGRMTSCQVHVDGSVVVGVERPLAGALAALGSARASARAGRPP